MAGAVKELARLVPLEEDERHLVGIVSRESERLNQIITEFLNYSREKTYEFADADIAVLLDETLTLLERHPAMDGKYRIEKIFAARPVRVRVDANRIKQVFWNFCDNAVRAMPDGGTLSVRLELDADPACASASRIPASGWIRASVKKYLNLCSQDSRAARVSA